MKLNFRKIASVLASAVMIGSTVGTALAANYPAPFVVGGKADAAIVVTSGSHLGASSDLFAALDLQKALQASVTSSTTSTSASVTGEAAPLFTDSSKIYFNDSLNVAKTGSLTKSDLPTVLADQTFNGNVDATYTQTILLGGNPYFTYAKQPTSSNDPQYGILESTTTANYIYNATVTFNKAVNFGSSDSKNQQLTLFGQKFTVGSASTTSQIVLLKEATKVDLDSQTKTSGDVTIGGKTYTIDLISASEAASATVKVTDKTAGTSDTKTVSVGTTKKISGLTVAVSTANSNNLKYAAAIVAGAEKVTLADGAAVTYGDDDTSIDGTFVRFTNTTGNTGTDSLTKIVVSVSAINSDKDALLPGTTQVDPVFGSFGLNFAGVNVPENSSAREDIKVAPTGDDKMSLTFTDWSGNTKTTQYIMNRTGQAFLEWDTDGHQIAIAESALLNYSDYAVIGNEGTGCLIKVSTITNATSGFSSDKVQFTNVLSGETYTASLTAEGQGTVSMCTKDYTVYYYGASTLASEAKTVRLNYQDSAAATSMVLYPTITTSKGAKVMLYKPINITLNNWDGRSNTLTGGAIKIPSFDNSYMDLDVTIDTTAGFTIEGDIINASQSGNTTITNTGLTFTFVYAGLNATYAYLMNPKTDAWIRDPAVVVMSEKDDNSQYQGMIITMEGAGSSTNGDGVDNIVRTWQPVGQSTTALASDSKKEVIAGLWGAIGLLDKSDSDQASATISYPDEQVYAQLYMTATGASITAGTTTSGGGVVEVVKDIDAATRASGKNLIVVGGSCINTVAAKLLDSSAPVCGADFTTKTKVDAGKYIVKSFASPFASGKVAVLVAGYESAQTVDAVTKLKEGLATDVGSEKIGPTAA
jgi:hypothetical protein